MLTILLAWLTKLLVEDPVRTGRFLVARRARWTFAFAVAATALVLAVTVGGSVLRRTPGRQGRRRRRRRLLAAKPRCFGAAARDPAAPVQQPEAASHRRPDADPGARARRTRPARRSSARSRATSARSASPRAKATATVALIGDSHASHWRAAADRRRRASDWRGLSITHTSCPLSKADEEARRARPLASASQWNRQVLAVAGPPSRGEHRLRRRASPAASWSSPRGRRPVRRAGRRLHERLEGAAALRRARDRHPRHAEDAGHDARLRRAGDGRPSARRPGLRGAAPRALDRDPAAVAVARARLGALRARRPDALPLRPAGAASRSIGGALVYKDIHHLTAVFGTSLGPYLQRDVER